jgi:uncharacterized protein
MKRYIRDRISFIMKLDDPPLRLAVSFAVGVFIAFSPIIGLHIVTCLFLAWAFRLNKLVILTAQFINNPWTIVPLYGFCIWLGLRLTGAEAVVPNIAWNDLTLTGVYSVLRPYLVPYVVGTLTAGAVAAVVSYFLFYWAVLRLRRKR